jgi:sugar-phosphatase
VVEDAPAGILSAKAAGCPVIGVLTTHDALDAPSVRSLADARFVPVDGGIEVRIPDSV